MIVGAVGIHVSWQTARRLVDDARLRRRLDCGRNVVSPDGCRISHLPLQTRGRKDAMQHTWVPQPKSISRVLVVPHNHTV